MTNIKDLEIEKEILPLFDFTLHPFAGEVLLQLLTEPPASVDEAITRQHIITGFVNHWDLLQTFSYSKADLHEAYHFLTDFTNDNWHFDNSTMLRVRLVLFAGKKHRLRAGLIQCLLLFHKLYNYFARVPAGSFPQPFGSHVESIRQFLLQFSTGKYEPAIRAGRFNNSHIAEVIRIISEPSVLQQIRIFWKNLFLFEAWFSITRAHIQYNFCFPVFTGDRFAIDNFYHPLLTSPVKNSIHNTRNVLLITGPNMSGKSTLLKAIGLCVYLGHLGLGVPAANCQMPFFDTISVALHVKDDLKKGYSHFLSEIKTLKSVATEAAANKRCFAVFDELFRGTNLEDALEISGTTMRGLAKFPRSFFLISTHLHQLKNRIDLSAISTHYIECHIKNNQPAFTYRLKTGWSEVKIGQLLFEQEGLNQLFNA